MATLTPQVELERQQAWTEYADRVRGLEGEEYDRAEHDAWEQLQATLQALDAPVAPLDRPPVG